MNNFFHKIPFFISKNHLLRTAKLEYKIKSIEAIAMFYLGSSCMLVYIFSIYFRLLFYEFIKQGDMYPYSKVFVIHEAVNTFSGICDVSLRDIMLFMRLPFLGQHVLIFGRKSLICFYLFS
jgi:hypothetical protein